MKTIAVKKKKRKKISDQAAIIILYVHGDDINKIKMPIPTKIDGK
tara:strand:+ start:516 stop:650 length:135 start_codon:yes stop_codon:yes gene_type:complete